MKSVVRMVIATLAVLGIAVSAGAAVYSGGDLLNGAGTFEDQGASGSGPWTFWADGGQTSTIDSTAPHTGSYSWHAHCPTAGKQARAYYNNIATVANRSHYLSSYVRQYASSASFIRWSVGLSGQQNFGTLYYSYASYHNYYTTANGEDNVGLTLYYRSNSAPNDHGLIDDIALYREVAMPMVSDVASAGGNVWSVTNEGGVVGENDQLVAYDPDAEVSYVSGFDVGNIAVTWVSDNELSVAFENQLSGSVTLQVTNPYGQAAQTFVVPEPMTLVLLGLGGMVLRRKA